MILAIRHPRPAIAPGICYGQLDVALAEPATTHMAGLLDSIAALPVAHIVSSPLRRAREMAEALASHLDIPLRLDARLMEMSFGAWEGIAWSDIPREEIEAWARDPLGYRPGGGETVGELQTRVAAAWREAGATSMNQLWLTHAGPMRCLLSLTTTRTLESCLDATLGYCEVMDVTPAASGRR